MLGRLCNHSLCLLYTDAPPLCRIYCIQFWSSVFCCMDARAVDVVCKCSAQVVHQIILMREQCCSFRNVLGQNEPVTLSPLNWRRSVTDKPFIVQKGLFFMFKSFQKGGPIRVAHMSIQFLDMYQTLLLMVCGWECRR